MHEETWWANGSSREYTEDTVVTAVCLDLGLSVTVTEVFLIGKTL